MAEQTPFNDLIKENSLYLRQHAHDPILWSTWDEESFSLAEYDSRLIFLCLGYAASPSSQILARNCFKDPEIAEILWQDFVPILVDREARPDIDLVYSEMCRTACGKVDYPIIAILTPAQEPIYIAPYDQDAPWSASAGMIELLTKYASAWRDQPQESTEKEGFLTDSSRQQIEDHPIS